MDRKSRDRSADQYADYEAVFIVSLWAFHLGLRDEKADHDYFTKLNRTLREMARSIPVYVFSDVPRLSVHPLRQLHFSKLGLNVDRELSDEHIRANAIVKQLVGNIPNVYWVDLSSVLDQFEYMSGYGGKPTYFDDHHLNVYGARTLGELFVNSGEHIIDQ